MEELFTKNHFIEVLEALHIDQTGLTQALTKVKKLANSWYWLADGARGSYEYDDDRYYEEIGRCLDSIINAVDEALSVSGKAHKICCGVYGHVHRLEKEPVQLEFPFGQTYEDFVERLINLSTIEGRIS